MKEIQEKRMKGYFLTAAKELIRAEGLAVVSARNVAERAGYSYATLYNYFKDIRDLIFNCVEDFMDECREFIKTEVPNTVSGEKALIAISNSYARFFIQYPGIFDLFFQEKSNQISSPRSNLSVIDKFFDSLVEQQWKTVMDQTQRTVKSISKVQEFHKLAIHGLLLFYLNRRTNSDYMAIMNQIGEMTRFAIKAF
jgi:AcrR family transcriptional regulator